MGEVSPGIWRIASEPFWLGRGSCQSCLLTSEQQGGGEQVAEERGEERPGFEDENTQGDLGSSPHHAGSLIPGSLGLLTWA